MNTAPFRAPPASPLLGWLYRKVTGEKKTAGPTERQSAATPGPPAKDGGRRKACLGPGQQLQAPSRTQTCRSHPQEPPGGQRARWEGARGWADGKAAQGPGAAPPLPRHTAHPQQHLTSPASGEEQA